MDEKELKTVGEPKKEVVGTIVTTTNGHERDVYSDGTVGSIKNGSQILEEVKNNPIMGIDNADMFREMILASNDYTGFSEVAQMLGEHWQNYVTYREGGTTVYDIDMKFRPMSKEMLDVIKWIIEQHIRFREIIVSGNYIYFYYGNGTNGKDGNIASAMKEAYLLLKRAQDLKHVKWATIISEQSDVMDDVYDWYYVVEIGEKVADAAGDTEA